MIKNIFKKIKDSDFSDIQIKSIQNILCSKDLYYTINDDNKKKFKNSLIKIGIIELKDNSTHIDMYIQKKSKARVILMRGNDKEFFIVSDQWLDVL